MKAIVKVSQLRTDDALYRRGDTVDFPEERIVQLGSSVERIGIIVETPREVEDVPEVADSTDVEEEAPVEADKPKQKRGRPKR
jgi:hypothetical protein